MASTKKRFGTLCLLLCLTSTAVAGKWQIPVDELLRGSAAVVTGRVVAQEKVEIRPGVFEVTQHVRIGEVLKGEPVRAELTTLAPVALASGSDQGGRGEREIAQTVRIRFLDGPNVPSGKVIYVLGDEGIWFLSDSGEDAPAGVYDASARHDLAALGEVRRLLGGGAEEDKTLGGVRPLTGRAAPAVGDEAAAEEARRDAEEGRNVTLYEFGMTTVEPKGRNRAVGVREALDLAERLVEENKIDVSEHQLASVVLRDDTKLAAYGRGLKTRVLKFWVVTYRPEGLVKGGQIYLHVNMAGEVRAQYGE